MKKVFIKIAKYKNRYLFKLIISCVLFVSVVISSGLWLYRNYYRYFVKDIHLNYQKNLSAVSTTVEDLFYSVIQSYYVLAEDKTISEVLMNVDPDSRQIPQNRNISTILNKHKIIHGDFIDSIMIIDREKNLVITNESSYDIDLYFNSIAYYKDYGKDFYLSDGEISGKQFSILKPIVTKNQIDKTEKRIIPIIFYKGTNYSLKNRMVINVDVEFLSRFLYEHSLSENSELIMYDIEGEIYSGNNQYYEIIGQYLDQNSLNSVFELDNEIIITYKNPHALFEQFNYMALIPQEDIDRNLVPLTRAYYLCISFCTFLALLISFYMSKSMYNPVKKLLDIFSFDIRNENGYYKNEFEIIEENIHRIVYNNSMLNAKLSVAEKIAAERLLIKLLTTEEKYEKMELKKDLDRFGINFKNDYYTIAISKFYYSELFYEKFDEVECKKLQESIVPLVMSFIPKDFIMYSIEIANNQFCFIFNVPDKSDLAKIKDIIEEFSQIYSSNNELVNVFSGIGTIKEELLSVSKSYEEALIAMSQFTDNSEECTIVYDSITMKENGIIVTTIEENKLHNYLINGKIEKTENLLTEIKNKCALLNFEEIEIKSIYLKLYAILQSTLNEKNIALEDIISGYEEKSLNEMSLDEIEAFIIKLYLYVSIYFSQKGKKSVIAEVVEYVNENFCEDFNLDMLADKFNVSSKYLSRAFKEYTNVRLGDYLNMLRISKAIELLENSDENVLDISQKVGFYSRHTFYRVFKNLQGMSPAEYRLKNKKTGGKT